jgi:uncharacterized membrane protein
VNHQVEPAASYNQELDMTSHDVSASPMQVRTFIAQLLCIAATAACFRIYIVVQAFAAIMSICPITLAFVHAGA